MSILNDSDPQDALDVFTFPDPIDPRPRWEYLHETIIPEDFVAGTNVQKHLRQRGQERWELVAISTNANLIHLLTFKRPALP